MPTIFGEKTHPKKHAQATSSGTAGVKHFGNARAVLGAKASKQASLPLTLTVPWLPSYESVV
jgi:hypothetical protein